VPSYIPDTFTQSKTILISISFFVTYDYIIDLILIYIYSVTMFYVYCKCYIDTVM
jgi:hypothetical protein